MEKPWLNPALQRPPRNPEHLLNTLQYVFDAYFPRSVVAQAFWSEVDDLKLVQHTLWDLLPEVTCQSSSTCEGAVTLYAVCCVHQTYCLCYNLQSTMCTVVDRLQAVCERKSSSGFAYLPYCHAGGPS